MFWKFPNILEVSKYFGSFHIFWKFPNILEDSKYFGTFQMFWNFPNILELSKYFGTFQIFWNFPKYLELPYYLEGIVQGQSILEYEMLWMKIEWSEWIWNYMKEFEILWMNMKLYERIWNIMNDYDEIALKIFIPKDLEWTFLQNMKKIAEYEKNCRIWWK